MNGVSENPLSTGLPVGHWQGAPVRAHWSVLVALMLFAAVLATSLLPVVRPGESQVAYWVTGVLAATVFLLSLLAHEMAHALMARHFGMRIVRITLWMLGGLTELEGDPPTPRADAVIAASGPLTSLGIGAVAGGLSWLVGGPGLLTAALTWLAEVNVLLAVFNLLPGAPLDGGRLLRALLWWRSGDRDRAADQAARAGRGLGIFLVALGVLELLAGGPLGLWLMLIGWFIISGAAAERAGIRAEKMRGLTARDAIAQPPAVAANWWTVEQFLHELTPEHAAQPVFPLVDFDGRFSGAIGVESLERTPADLRDSTRLRDLPGRPVAVAEATTPLPDLLPALRLRGGVAVVVEEGRPVGVLTDREIARTAQLAELGWSATRTGSA